MDDDSFDQELLKRDERERNGQWRLSREISVANVITLVMIAFAVIGAYYSLSGRVTSTEQSIAAQKYTDDRQDAEAQRTDARTQSALDNINRKLDRLIERR